jgi:hypothetical protein
MKAPDIARLLAERVDQLVRDLLPAGHHEGHEWRCGSVAGESGNSLGVHLTGNKRGVWSDFSTDQKGDALNLVRAVLGLDTPAALRWSCRWLGIEEGTATLPVRSPSPARSAITAKPASDFWLKAWNAAPPITGTRAETYLRARGLQLDDPEGRVLRFAERHARRNAAGDIEHHPALIALLDDIRTGEPAGTINVYLKPDGSDRLRDAKGKTSWGRAAGSAVMLSDFDEPTLGLAICEGVETGISLLMASLTPVWCCGGAGNLAAFPVLGGIEALTIAADADEPGQKAAEAVAQRWRDVQREAVIIAPPDGDWADVRKVAA